MFRTKVIAIHKELGEDAAGITGFRKSSEYAKAVMTPLYAHLSA